MADDVLVQDYNEGRNAFRVGIKTLNIKKVKAAKGDNSKVVLVAARHLCREIRREIHKVGGRIDSSKSKRNFILIGPDNAAAIAAEADAVMDAHDINRAKLREDAIMAIEVISSLPRGSAIPLQEYAEASIAFFNARFAAPAKAIFAIAHVDEGAPHVHMLFVPLVNGGSGLGGDAVRKMAGTQDEIDEAFYQEVGKRYGLEKPIRKVRLPYVGAGTTRRPADGAILGPRPGTARQRLGLQRPVEKARRRSVDAGAGFRAGAVEDRPDSPRLRRRGARKMHQPHDYV